MQLIPPYVYLYNVHLHRHELSFVIIFICLFIIKGPIEVIEQEHSVTPNDAELIQVRIYRLPHT